MGPPDYLVLERQSGYNLAMPTCIVRCTEMGVVFTPNVGIVFLIVNLPRKTILHPDLLPVVNDP